MSRAKDTGLEKETVSRMARALHLAEKTMKKAGMLQHDVVQASDDGDRAIQAILATKIFDALKKTRR